MTNRYDNALTIILGAVNPSGIAHSIIEACEDIRREGGGTQAIYDDPAVRLMVYELAFLCKTPALDTDLHEYGILKEACVRKISTATMKEQHSLRQAT